MRNFIRNIIDRLRDFIRADAHDTTEPAVNDSTRPIPDEVDFDVDRSRSSIVVLTRSGIRFKGLRYNSPAVAEMLVRMRSGDRVKVRIKDPSDASSIFVWDSSDRPTPRWITVGIADAPTKLSFARLRDFARKQELAFSTEAERSEALERLKQHWKKLAEQLPIGESRQRLRAVRQLTAAKAATGFELGKLLSLFPNQKYSGPLDTDTIMRTLTAFVPPRQAGACRSRHAVE